MMQNIDKKLQDQNSNIDKRFHDHSSDMEKRFQDHTAVVQKMNNKLVTLERQQAQGSKRFQPHYQNPPPFRQPNQGQAPWTQNRLMGNAATAITNANPVRTLCYSKQSCSRTRVLCYLQLFI